MKIQKTNENKEEIVISAAFYIQDQLRKAKIPLLDTKILKSLKFITLKIGKDGQERQIKAEIVKSLSTKRTLRKSKYDFYLFITEDKREIACVSQEEIEGEKLEINVKEYKKEKFIECFS
jgi:hypothetical protein